LADFGSVAFSGVTTAPKISVTDPTNLATMVSNLKDPKNSVLATASINPLRVQYADDLSDVKHIVSDSAGDCALLTSGRVDCWGYGADGELGNGRFYSSSPNGSVVPVTVVSTTDAGSLSGVASLSSDGYGFCALLSSGGVDCWGGGSDGQLGNGQFYSSSPYGSAFPIAVVVVAGS